MTKAEGRRFGLTVGISFAALAGLLWWRDRIPTAAAIGAMGALLILAALLLPTRLGRVERVWMAVAHAISKVTTPLVMGMVYFSVVTPIGLVMRLVGRNPLARRDRAGSFWVKRDIREEGQGTMNHQF